MKFIFDTTFFIHVEYSNVCLCSTASRAFWAELSR